MNLAAGYLKIMFFFFPHVKLYQHEAVSNNLGFHIQWRLVGGVGQPALCSHLSLSACVFVCSKNLMYLS